MRNEKTFFSKYVTPIFTTPDSFSHWFGYYNISPMNSSNTRLLAHRISFEGRNITAEDMAEVGWFEMSDGSWHPIGITNAINWQQGSSLQWLPGNPENSKIIYNNTRDKKFVAVIKDIQTGGEQIIDWPIYGITTDGKTSISVQYERAYWCRAYHYESVRNEECNVQIMEDDGIFKVDLETNSTKRIISIQDIIALDPEPNFKFGKHWLEHIILNSEGTRFAFYHRCTFKTDNDFLTRIITADIDGQNMYILENWREVGRSHLNWRTGEELVVFGNKNRPLRDAYVQIVQNTGAFGSLTRTVYKNSIGRFLPRRVHHDCAIRYGYERIWDRNGMIGFISKGDLLHDGHPSFTKDGRFMLTDTYPEFNSCQKLLLYDFKLDKVIQLACLYSPYMDGSYRCDLHPRFSPDEQYIIIDTAESGRHQMMVMRVDWDLIK